MCGRFTYLTYDELADVVEAVEQRKNMRLQRGIERGEARPGSSIHALVPHAAQLEIAPLTWGFRLSDDKKLVFNTRIESALGGSPLWAKAIQKGRCILPAASFFEPHMSETVRSPRTGRLIKRQYEFADAHGAPLLLASVHDNGRLSVVTTEPNASVSRVHGRMPLLLRFEEAPVWLEGDFASLADRTGFELAVQPEDRGDEPNDSQLSLF